jgi:acyl-CoA thioesterase-1
MSTSLGLASGERFLFLGDSITEADPGYTRLTAAMVTTRHPEVAVRWIYRGVSGNKVTDLLDRLDRDVLAERPDWVAVSIGINDVWHGYQIGGKGVPLDAFRRHYHSLVSRMRDQGIRLLCLTPTVIGEEPDSEANQVLVGYAAAIREEAREARAVLVDMHTAFRDVLTRLGGRERLTTDGVHMNMSGNLLMADTLYRALLHD